MLLFFAVAMELMLSLPLVGSGAGVASIPPLSLPRCRMRPAISVPGTWATLLTEHSHGFKRVLLVCVPRSALASRHALTSQTADLDVNAARNAQAVRATRTSAQHSALAGACVLLLAAEVCQHINPPWVPSAAKVEAFPAMLTFSRDAAGQWLPRQRSRADVRRMNGCGLHAECLLLDLAEMAHLNGDGPEWVSLDTAWPEGPKLPPPKAVLAMTQAASTSKLSAVQQPEIAECLVDYIEEVVRFRHAHDDVTPAASSFTTSSITVFVVHYTGLPRRKLRMRQRLRAAGLEHQAIYVEMVPDYVNNTMRRCLGPFRRQSIDSMADDPNWRYPTRGEDSLAVKHLATATYLTRFGMPHALVLEDDTWFSQHLASDVASLLEELATLEWDVVAVGTCYHHRTPFGRRVLPHVWLTQVMPCAHAYLLSRKGASALLRTLPLEMPIDLQINTMAQDGTPYASLRQGKWSRGKLYSNIYWAEPQLAFQWPEDVTRSVERS